MPLRKIIDDALWGSDDAGAFSRALSVSLTPMGWIYGSAARLREVLYRQGVIKSAQTNTFIVSIGNITLGGSGKTPLTIAIASELIASGIKIAIVTRGYGGSDKSSARIVKPDDNPAEVGDEAVLMAATLRDVPVVKSAKRADGAALAEKTFSPDVILLDDAFGHISIKRDIDIVIVDVKRGFGNGRTFPAGALREPLSALKRANAIMLREDIPDPAGREIILAQVKKFAPDVKIFNISASAIGVVSVVGEKEDPIDSIKGKTLVAFCGIASPASFFSTLEKLGATVAAKLDFPDHHTYSAKDIRDIASAVSSSKADALITTEKDLVRLKGVDFGDAPLMALRIKMKVEGLKWLKEKIESRKKNLPSI